LQFIKNHFILCEEGFMSTVDIAKKIKVFNNPKGKPAEVLIPFSFFEELMELKTTMEIYKQEEVQASLRRAKKELREGKTTSFTSIHKALRWLRK
jgi:hypothetical protein